MPRWVGWGGRGALRIDLFHLALQVLLLFLPRLDLLVQGFDLILELLDVDLILISRILIIASAAAAHRATRALTPTALEYTS